MHSGVANVLLSSLSQMFHCTCVTFNDNSDNESTWSFGQMLLKCLWPLLLFLVLCPGRDTQDDGLTNCIGKMHGPYYMSHFFNFFSSVWSIFATKSVMVLGVIHAALHHSIVGTKIQAYERKHGRWRLSQILPMFLMVPSCINVTSAQAASLQVHT